MAVIPRLRPTMGIFIARPSDEYYFVSAGRVKTLYSRRNISFNFYLDCWSEKRSFL